MWTISAIAHCESQRVFRQALKGEAAIRCRRITLGIAAPGVDISHETQLSRTSAEAGSRWEDGSRGQCAIDDTAWRLRSMAPTGCKRRRLGIVPEPERAKANMNWQPNGGDSSTKQQ